MARTADSMVPWPEMMTTSGGVDSPISRMLLQHIQAVAVGQPDVEQNNVVLHVANELERPLTAVPVLATA